MNNLSLIITLSLLMAAFYGANTVSLPTDNGIQAVNVEIEAEKFKDPTEGSSGNIWESVGNR